MNIMPGKCKFNNDWLGIDKYKAWLCCVPGNRHKASCKICHKTFDIVNIGESAIGSHANRKFLLSCQGGKSQELQ